LAALLKPVPSSVNSFGQLATNPLVAGQRSFENPNFGLTQGMAGRSDPTMQLFYGFETTPSALVPITEPATWDDALPMGTSSMMRGNW
jgi:hypothetical protein